MDHAKIEIWAQCFKSLILSLAKSVLQTVPYHKIMWNFEIKSCKNSPVKADRSHYAKTQQ